MKISRAVLFLLAGMAGGIGVRLAFTFPAGTEKDVRRGAGDVSARKTREGTSAPESSSSAARPQEEAILTVHKGARHRLLLAWLPGAGEEDLLRMADALTASDQYDYLAIRLLMVRWAEVNPGAMLEWARAKSQGRSTHQHITDAITAWARVDFDGAWAAAGAGLPGTRGSALLGLAGTDPDKCLGLLRADPKLLCQHWSFMDDVVKKIAARDPAGTAALLSKVPAEHHGDFAGLVVRAWVKTDAAGALAWIGQQHPDIRENSLVQAGKWLAVHAPEHLSAVLESLPAGAARAAIQAEILAHLAATDPDAARRQLDTMPAGAARQYGRALLMKELFQRGDDAGAAALAAQLGWHFDEGWSPSYRGSVFGQNLKNVFVDESAGEESAPVRVAMSQLLDRIAERDPKQAAALLANCSEESFQGLLNLQTPSEPAALAQALVTANDTKSLRHLNSLAEKWMGLDPVAAMSWAGTQPFLQPSFMSFWGGNVHGALNWAATLPVEKRGSLLRQTVRSWTGSGDYLRSAISNSPLPEGEKQQLMDLAFPSPP